MISIILIISVAAEPLNIYNYNYNYYRASRDNILLLYKNLLNKNFFFSTVFFLKKNIIEFLEHDSPFFYSRNIVNPRFGARVF